jgi:hypothetical protein
MGYIALSKNDGDSMQAKLPPLKRVVCFLLLGFCRVGFLAGRRINFRPTSGGNVCAQRTDQFIVNDILQTPFFPLP